MTKKIKPTEPLTKEQLVEYKPEDQAAKLQEVMGLGLTSAFNLAVKEGATVVKTVAPTSKAFNTDALPETKK